LTLIRKWEMDAELPEKSDPDPEIIFSNLTHWLKSDRS